MWWFHWVSMRLMRVEPVRLLAPIDSSRLETLDGFIIGGGDDIGAELYQGEPALDVRIDPARDKMEMAVLSHATPRHIPVLGVCRGAQMLNVFMGGSLHQDMRRAFQDVPPIWTPLPRKTVHLIKGTRLQRIFDLDHLRVNSLHRQAIDRLGEGLIVAAKDEHGVTQAIETTQCRFCFGVQWHPEFLIYSASQRRLFRTFVETVEKR
jgi:putative glutamine amidotransferase